MKSVLEKKNITFIKYFLSYFVILSVSIMGFFYAVQFELKNVYFKSLNNQNSAELKQLEDIIASRFFEIDRIHLLIQENTIMLLSRYTNDNYYSYLAAKEIQNHTVGNFLLDDVLYLDKKQETCLSSKKLVQYKNNRFSVYFDGKFKELPLKDWYADRKNKLVYWKGKKESLFFYIPSISTENYYLVYVINEFEFKKLLSAAISPSVTSICFTDGKGTVISQVNGEEISPYLSSLEKKEDGYYEVDKASIAYVLPPLFGNFRILALSSREMVLSSVSSAFQNTYLTFISLSMFGLLLIMLAMQITYRPLQKLTKKIAPEMNSQGGYLQQISDAFDSTLKKNSQLQAKIDNYRIIMHESILNSILVENNGSKGEDISQIDQFFHPHSYNSIFSVKILLSSNISAKEIRDFILQALPSDGACLLLEQAEAYAVFLINYCGTENDKEEVISLLFQDFYKETACKTAISNITSNPMDIPALYENALLACSFWEASPVVSYSKIADSIPKETSFSYPYKKLETFSKELENFDFPKANTTLRELFELIDQKTNPDFFIRCILIDIITVIINLMNKSGIRFETINDLYYETLYYCRTLSYAEKHDAIKANMYHIISVFEEETANSCIHISQVKQFIQENYLSSEFSNTMLADHFHVSMAYMSYLFKKKTNENLSDYVWNLRLEKAKDMLRNTDLSIDEISIRIGYLNPSSFRRKFKQTMNTTPSHYRI
ncbi:helix-turn-helix domain-containing protein [Anaerocolumna jejuensis]|uniref:helix-turn-helix domain-containing protein n=1 Tax=Anaerocolumna jejuensis TaxID=259063 RepID=UPI003F7B4091